MQPCNCHCHVQGTSFSNTCLHSPVQLTIRLPLYAWITSALTPALTFVCPPLWGKSCMHHIQYTSHMSDRLLAKQLTQGYHACVSRMMKKLLVMWSKYAMGQLFSLTLCSMAACMLHVAQLCASASHELVYLLSKYAAVHGWISSN